MIDVHAIMHRLAERRPIFHSEADFQHAFAWELHQCLPGAQVRLELPVQVEAKRLHLDIWVANQGRIAAIELKYPTARLNVAVDGEEYHLAAGAPDYSLYDYIKDVERLEQITGTYSNAAGYAIMLTNDRAHWTPSPNSIGAAFRLPEGREVRGSGTWGTAAGAGSKKGYEREIVLGGSYTVRWHDYARVDASAGGSFRYMLIGVGGAAPANHPSHQG
ncbi:MAG: hypothetical protein U0X20_00130 [Caldilineaceae bacterium]